MIANSSAKDDSHKEASGATDYSSLPTIHFEGLSTARRAWLLSEVHDCFSRHGIIHVVRLDSDSTTGLFNGRGSVTYLRQPYADKAVAALDGTTDAYGSRLSVWQGLPSNTLKRKAPAYMAAEVLASMGRDATAGMPLHRQQRQGSSSSPANPITNPQPPRASSRSFGGSVTDGGTWVPAQGMDRPPPGRTPSTTVEPMRALNQDVGQSPWIGGGIRTSTPQAVIPDPPSAHPHWSISAAQASRNTWSWRDGHAENELAAMPASTPGGRADLPSTPRRQDLSQAFRFRRWSGTGQGGSDDLGHHG